MRKDPAGDISIHALREEGDPETRPTREASTNFYPRPPRGGRPTPHRKKGRHTIFLSTPSARRATPALLRYVAFVGISIHALREEGDFQQAAIYCYHQIFLSTPSARRATSKGGEKIDRPSDFYPRPPRGGRPAKAYSRVMPGSISIHALREEGDLAFAFCPLNFLYFYPRPPRGGRPAKAYSRVMPGSISIHALREEGDLAFAFCPLNFLYFYPRPPRGGRPPQAAFQLPLFQFLSTPSARRAT